MYRVTKVLNHNTILAVKDNSNQECLIMGKGIGFGRKVSERVMTSENDTIYYLELEEEKGLARDIVKSLSLECLEITDQILKRAEETFGKIDRSILLTMAEHLQFAVKRIKNNEQIKNPFLDDIRILFHVEYNVAKVAEPLLKEKLGVKIADDEIGYIALHIHAAIEDEEVAQSLKMAQSVRECVQYVEKEVGRKLDVFSLSYNRLMNHVKYMVARTLNGESIPLDMNDFMMIKCPKAYKMAESVCEELSKSLKHPIKDVEIGYLAMHIERVSMLEQDDKI